LKDTKTAARVKRKREGEEREAAAGKELDLAKAELASAKTKAAPTYWLSIDATFRELCIKHEPTLVNLVNLVCSRPHDGEHKAPPHQNTRPLPTSLYHTPSPLQAGCKVTRWQ